MLKAAPRVRPIACSRSCVAVIRSSAPASPHEHRLYHFRLPFSGFESNHVVLGGERGQLRTMGKLRPAEQFYALAAQTPSPLLS